MNEPRYEGVVSAIDNNRQRVKLEGSDEWVPIKNLRQQFNDKMVMPVQSDADLINAMRYLLAEKLNVGDNNYRSLIETLGEPNL